MSFRGPQALKDIHEKRCMRHPPDATSIENPQRRCDVNMIADAFAPLSTSLRLPILD
jgi:hypothetical protein